MIYYGQCRHSFYDGYGPRNHAGIVTATTFDHDFLSLLVDSVLRSNDGGNWLESCPEIDGHSIGDTPLYASGIVGFGADLSVRSSVKFVVVVGTIHTDPVKPASDVKTLAGVDAHYRFGKFGMKFIKYGFSQTRSEERRVGKAWQRAGWPAR